MARCTGTSAFIPTTATAGLSYAATVDLSAYPAPDWVLSLHMRGVGSIDLTATPDGASHAFSASGATTADWAAGEYWYSLRATDGADVVEIETGQLRVLPDLVGAGAGYDGRTQAEIALDAIDAVLANRATIDQQRYRINNRELYRTDIADLLKLRTFYASQVARETAKKTGRSGFGRQITVRFS